MDALTGVRVAAQLENLRAFGDFGAEELIDSLIGHVASANASTSEHSVSNGEVVPGDPRPIANTDLSVEQKSIESLGNSTSTLQIPEHVDWFKALAAPQPRSPGDGTVPNGATLPDDVYNFIYGPDADLDAIIDVQKVKHAQRFFETYGLHVSAVLLHQSLPEAYACARGAQVLYLTSELVSHPARRIRETARMLIAVLSEDPAIADQDRQHLTTLHAGQVGARLARRVRLFHGIVRKMFESESDPTLSTRWKEREQSFERHGRPTLGQPINQEDQLGTLFTFTVSVFEGLGRLGVPYNDDDIDAWFHVWDVVGRHLGVGVESALSEGESHCRRPAEHDIFGTHFTPKVSTELMAVIRRRHQEGSHEGKILANALLQEVQKPLSRSMKPLPAMLIRYLAGDEVRTMLGVRSGGWGHYWANRLLISRRVSKVAIGRPTRFSGGELSAMMGREILQMFTDTSPLNVFENRDRGGVQLPDSLCRSWGIHSPKSLDTHWSSADIVPMPNEPDPDPLPYSVPN